MKIIEQIETYLNEAMNYRWCVNYKGEKCKSGCLSEEVKVGDDCPYDDSWANQSHKCGCYGERKK
jgi:hypothetical protein